MKFLNVWDGEDDDDEVEEVLEIKKIKLFREMEVREEEEETENGFNEPVEKWVTSTYKLFGEREISRETAQKLAKRHGIRANLKTKEIVRTLKRKGVAI